MNREKFHNELAMRLGYERIVNDKSIFISVEDSDDPWVTLRVEGSDDFRFKASCCTDVDQNASPEMREDVVDIMNAVHLAYVDASTCRF
jgi:hypothetical protein